MKYQSHPLKSVIPLSGFDLLCYFKNGKVKLFNFSKIIEEYPQFKALKKNNLFFKAHVDLGGLCVTFNDDIDISEEALYQNGVDYNIKKENKKIQKQVINYCKTLRKKSGITQKDLSLFTGIPQSGIARIEAGNNGVNISTLLNYLDPLGYTIKIEKKDF